MDHIATPYTGVNLKWDKDLNVRPKTLKFLEENKGSEFADVTLSTIFPNISNWAREAKGKINMWDYIKPKSFSQQRKPSIKQKDILENRRRYLPMIHRIRGASSILKKNTYHSTPKKLTTQLKNGQRP